MVKRGSTNPRLNELISKLKSANKGVWEYTAKLLSRPTRIRPWINLSQIQKNYKDGEIVLVPGKVLGAGELTNPITVAAWRFSDSAREKIKNAKGKCLSIEELMKSNPDGHGVRVLIA